MTSILNHVLHELVWLQVRHVRDGGGAPLAYGGVAAALRRLHRRRDGVPRRGIASQCLQGPYLSRVRWNEKRLSLRVARRSSHVCIMCTKSTAWPTTTNLRQYLRVWSTLCRINGDSCCLQVRGTRDVVVEYTPLPGEASAAANARRAPHERPPLFSLELGVVDGAFGYAAAKSTLFFSECHV